MEKLQITKEVAERIKLGITESLNNHEIEPFINIIEEVFINTNSYDEFAQILDLIDFELSISNKLNIIHEYAFSNTFRDEFKYVCKKFFNEDDVEDFTRNVGVFSSANHNDVLVYLVENNLIDKEELTSHPEYIISCKFFTKLLPFVDIDNYKFKTYYSYFLDKFSTENEFYDEDDEDKPNNLNIIQEFLHLSNENVEFMLSFTKEHLDNLKLTKNELDFFNNLSLNFKLQTKLQEKNSTENKKKI